MCIMCIFYEEQPSWLHFLGLSSARPQFTRIFFIESRQTDFSVQHLSKILYIVVSWQLKKEILIFMHANSFTIVENGNGHHKSSAACIDEFSRRFFLCSFWSFSILIWFAFFFSNSHFFFLFVSRNFARHTRNINRAQQ